MFTDNNITELKERLGEETGKDYYLYREHFKWGCYPAFRTDNKEDPNLYYISDLNKFLPVKEFFEHIKETWRPSNNEDYMFFQREMESIGK